MPHIIPFAGGLHSGPINQNLLWQDGDVFLVDNHRTALWCWKQKVGLYSQPHSLMPSIGTMTRSARAYMSETYRTCVPLRLRAISRICLRRWQDGFPRFRWDNYLSIYLRQFKDQLRMLRLVPPKDGDRPRFQPQIESAPDEFPENINFWLDDGPWVVNVDLDYIFCADASGDWIQMVSDDYIVETVRGIRKAMNDDHMAVVCLTPDGFTPGWPECLRLSKRIFKILRTSHPRI